MERIDVVAVLGTCPEPRREFAAQLCKTPPSRVLFPSLRLGVSPHPIREALELLPWTNEPAGAVCEFPSATNPMELIGQFVDEDSGARLTDVVCVVDAMHLVADLQRDNYYQRLMRGRDGRPMTHYTAHAMLTVLQIECASVIVLVNSQMLPGDEQATVRSLIGHLAPRARVHDVQDMLDVEVLARSLTGRQEYSAEQDRAGWVALLNGDRDPSLVTIADVADRGRVSGFRYENLRPFHPRRLQHLLDERIEPGEFGTVIRSAGMCRLATRPHTVGSWEHVGQMFSLEPLGADFSDAADVAEFVEDTTRELLALGQEIAFIGLDLQHEALEEALDEVVLTDEELVAGPHAWAQFVDPFPAWEDGIAPRQN